MRILWLIFVAFLAPRVRFAFGDLRNRWTCVDDVFCRRLTDVADRNATAYPTVALCRLTCGKNSNVWPKPQKINVGDRDLFLFSNVNLRVMSMVKKATRELLDEMMTLFRKKVAGSRDCRENATVNVLIFVEVDDTQLNWNTNESYTFSMNHINSFDDVNVYVKAHNIFGIRHALETLSQLIEVFPNSKNNQACLSTLKSVTVKDYPKYVHRGLLIDTARNPLTITTIKRQLDAMASSKLNTLHWHLTDSQSFPFESPSVINMTKYGAFSSKNVYKYDDVKELIYYAKIRGIRIVFELDSPSHAGFGWQWGPEAGLGNLTVCLNEQPWRSFCVQPPCGQLNPANQNIYTVLKKLYADINELSNDMDVFHMGGDEVFIPCWNSTQEIIDYIGNRPRTLETFLDLWGEFQEKALRSFDRAVGNSKSTIVVWTSTLTEPDVIEDYLDKSRFVIQTWVPDDNDLPERLLKIGYRVIISTKNAWYLDHGFWGITKYHDWQTVYQNVLPDSSGVLGGEVCMWGEYVDDQAVDGRIWPRAAAAAERLWTNPTRLYDEAKRRFYRHRERLIALGVRAETVCPKWCYLNEGFC